MIGFVPVLEACPLVVFTPLQYGYSIAILMLSPCAAAKARMMAWLAWAADDFPQSTVVRMVQDGLLNIPGDARQQFSFSSLAGVLRSVGIGLGRDRYSRLLVEEMRGCEQKLANPREFADEDGQIDTDRQASATRRLRPEPGRGHAASDIPE